MHNPVSQTSNVESMLNEVLENHTNLLDQNTDMEEILVEQSNLPLANFSSVELLTQIATDLKSIKKSNKCIIQMLRCLIMPTFIK